MQYKTRLFLLKRNFERDKNALWKRFLTSSMGVRNYESALQRLERNFQDACIQAFMEEIA